MLQLASLSRRQAAGRGQNYADAAEIHIPASVYFSIPDSVHLAVGHKEMGLDSVELVMSVEEHFAIEIPDDVAEALVTVGSLHAFVVSELQRVHRPRDSEVVFVELRELICDQLGIKPERVVPEARFVQDLHID